MYIHRAIQLHPNTPSLYIYAANHELRTNGSPAAGRALLQRGIRLNKESVLLWNEYVKFELGFVGTLQKRWHVLGLSGTEKHDEGGADIRLEEMESEEAQKEIMKGAIVKTVMAEAIKGDIACLLRIKKLVDHLDLRLAIPTMAMFTSLHGLLTNYPSVLRNDLMEELDMSLLKTNLARTKEGIKLHARMALGEMKWAEEDFIDKLRKVNEEIMGVIMGHEEEFGEAYGELIEIWCGGGVEESVVSAYL